LNWSEIEAHRARWDHKGYLQCGMIALQVHAQGNCCTLRSGHLGPHLNFCDQPFERAVRDSSKMHAEIVKMCRCEEHPRYAARRKPAGGCERCWRIWILTHPSYDLESRWMR
jgi:hypothetical protein